MLTKYAATMAKQAILNASGNRLYCGLIKGTPDQWGDNVQELDYEGYQRQLITFGTGSNPFSVDISHEPTANTNEVSFPYKPANSPNDNVGYIGYWDAEEGGNLIEFVQIVEISEQGDAIPTAYPIGESSNIDLGVGALVFGEIVNTPCKPSSNCSNC